MLYLPQGLPSVETLRSEGFLIGEAALNERVANAQYVLMLNLMPEKAKTELDLSRMIVQEAQERDIQLIPIKIPGQTYKTTPMSYMDAYYEDFIPEKAELPEGNCYQLIITGAPLEFVAYEDVRYWKELCEIMDWASSNKIWTLNLCWAAFAAMHYFEHIPTHHLEEKRFGLFPQRIKEGFEESPILLGMSNSCSGEWVFPLPTSRFIELDPTDFEGNQNVTVIAAGDDTGVGIIWDEARCQVSICGHLEYERLTLHSEYLRDMSRNLPIHPAEYYYKNNVPQPENVEFSWHQTALCFYRNFLRLR